jgi:hypothetical protein
MVTWAMRIARTSTDRLVGSRDPDPVTWKIRAITATNAVMVMCLEKDHATLAARPPST